MRTLFASELKQLQDEVLMMGSMVIHAIKEAVDILKRQDLDGAQRVIDGDVVINDKRYTIEARVLTLIATQQPMARDLRLLAAVLEIVTELERMGDYAKGIGKITLLLGRDPLVKPLVEIPQMSEMVVDMLRRSLDAFVDQDLEVARSLPLEDDAVDALYNKVQRDLLSVLLEKPQLMERANYLLWAAHNLERAADRVTNICERII
ncbi:MAG: phosphate signaling complex protein PhoU, partial [Caldilineaceae bacterium]|nr:phosphate signaling complex protein PhoU [Caldilineaceae bacterium]